MFIELLYSLVLGILGALWAPILQISLLKLEREHSLLYIPRPAKVFFPRVNILFLKAPPGNDLKRIALMT